MKLAKASKEEIDNLYNLLTELEAATGDYFYIDTRYEDFKNDLKEDPQSFNILLPMLEKNNNFMEFFFDLCREIREIHFQRIIWNLTTLLENCADPELDHLDFKPEIKKGLELLEKPNT